MLLNSLIKSAKTWHSTTVPLKSGSMIDFQNDNHHHYQQFYREMYDFLDVEYGNDDVTWYRGRISETRGSRGRRH